MTDHKPLAELKPIAGVKITRVETIPLHVPLKQPTKISQGAARETIEIMIVRLHTDAGISGIGETQAWRRQGNAETLPGLNTVIRDHFAPLIVGRSPLSIAAIMASLDAAIYHSFYAQAAISDALYDLQGKLTGLPVHALIGGKCRDAVAAGAVLFMKPTIEETMDGAQEFYARGFRSFNMKVGVDARADLRNVSALRDKLGDNVTIRVDANAGMEFDAALALLRKIEPYNIDAAEQLLPIWDLDGMAELARRSDIPLMTDEGVASEHDLIAVIKKCAATVVQTKIAKNGGIWRSLHLWHIAKAAGMRIYPGNHPSTSIATLAAAHLAAAWPGALLEGPFAVGKEVLAEDVVTEPLKLDGNLVRVPDTPGLGVTLDEDRIRALRVDL
jgi:L-alanine-DL-glutamate epimerase-like enolase superfamily enzyme